MSASVFLNLWKKNLWRRARRVWERTNLTTLILADNQLTAISEELGQLSDLRTLDLGHNQLSELPEALGRLASLSDFLYLHDNLLTTLPSSIERLQKFRYLNQHTAHSAAAKRVH